MFERVDCDYYTDAIDYTQVKPLRESEKCERGGGGGAGTWRCAG